MHIISILLWLGCDWFQPIIIIRITSLALRQSYVYPSTSETILMNMGKLNTWLNQYFMTEPQKHKNSKTVCICKEHWLSSQLLTFLQHRSSQPWNYWFQKHITQHTDVYTRAPLLWASSFPKAHAISYVLNTWIIWRHLKIEDRL